MLSTRPTQSTQFFSFSYVENLSRRCVMWSDVPESRYHLYFTSSESRTEASAATSKTFTVFSFLSLSAFFSCLFFSTDNPKPSALASCNNCTYPVCAVVFHIDSNLTSLTINLAMRLVSVRSFARVDSHALTKYLYDGGKVLIFLLWLFDLVFSH